MTCWTSEHPSRGTQPRVNHSHVTSRDQTCERCLTMESSSGLDAGKYLNIYSPFLTSSNSTAYSFSSLNFLFFKEVPLNSYIYMTCCTQKCFMINIRNESITFQYTFKIKWSKNWLRSAIKSISRKAVDMSSLDF